MGRRIVWSEYQSSDGGGGAIDGYFDRLLKYIPADVVGFWLAGDGLIRGQAGDGGLAWLLFVVGLVFAFFFTKKQTAEAGKATAWQQIWLSCGSFVVWVFAVGGPFTGLAWYKPIYGSLLLITYATSIPLLPAPKQQQ